ncbi:ubiquitin carboxyl-terminal hydrolase 15-like [Vicia villosa]|uniref:ubiquitin carboxyl-terminal hydrolase 15-like n=1 Tax=Vicia villosa TaxID=3911 RepID=UPI00273B1B71|nr:ubiquitin carboxyl-terminal hydrolase 15-like [Vicia villosa]
MVVADVIPPQPQVFYFPKNNEPNHDCARCSAPAKTRCSRCKFVRYCSGNCQIIHWRQIHKQECQQLETHESSSFPLSFSVEEFGHASPFYDNLNNPYFGCNLNNLDNLVHPLTGTAAVSATADISLFNNSQPPTLERRASRKSNRESRRRDSGSIYESSFEFSDYKAMITPQQIHDNKAKTIS